jgi:PucR C-terminal helix-turn-helix domain/GGDEF-like domain
MDTDATDAQTSAAVGAVATALLPESPRIGAQVAGVVMSRCPEFVQRGASELLIANIQANHSALLDGLIRSVPMRSVAPTEEVRQLTREYAKHELPLRVLMRGFRVAVRSWTEVWAEAVRVHTEPGVDQVSVVEAGTSFLLDWLDEFSERLTEEYLDESERQARERSLVQIEDVRKALSDPDLDIAAISVRLGYRLNGGHLALVLRHDGHRADSAVRQLVAAISPGRALIVRVDTRTTWCWVPYTTAPPRPVTPASPLIAAAGRPRRGLAGFRESHREALAALRVAELSRCRPGSLTQYDHVAIAAVCSSDLDACRAFIRTELGALAADNEATDQVRTTLEAFFASNSNFRATATLLGVHHNTVRYRVERATEILGRPPAERRLALELALHLTTRLGPVVLEQDD